MVFQNNARDFFEPRATFLETFPKGKITVLLLCGDDRELTDTGQLLPFVGQVTGGHQTDLTALDGRTADYLLDWVGLDVGELALRHLLAIHEELIVGDVA